MSDAIEDGGPAFPVSLYDGMSLRDWFAGMALPKVIEESYFYHHKVLDMEVRSGDTTWFEIDREIDSEELSIRPESVAFACYGFADAMLEARKE